MNRRLINFPRSHIQIWPVFSHFTRITTLKTKKKSAIKREVEKSNWKRYTSNTPKSCPHIDLLMWLLMFIELLKWEIDGQAQLHYHL